MYCPRCGQERFSEATRFCSKCGFLLTGTTELLRTGGALPVITSGPGSPRSRGIRQGLFMFLLTFVIAPVVGLISTFGLGMDPWPVGVVVVLLGFGGLMRIAYAMMFEEKYTELPGEPLMSALPPETAKLKLTSTAQPEIELSRAKAPVSGHGTPGSITEGTTRLLDADQEPSE